MYRLHYIFHLTAYYIAWFLCIYLAANHYAWWSVVVVLFVVLTQLYWQIVVMQDTKNLYLMLALITIVGSLIDTIYLHVGLIYFESNPLSPYATPPWMISIWVSFAMIYYALLKNLHDRYYLLGFLSFMGFTAAYYVGAEMGAAVFPYGKLTSLLIGVTWSVALPASMLFYNNLTRKP